MYLVEKKSTSSVEGKLHLAHGMAIFQSPRLLKKQISERSLGFRDCKCHMLL
jgi:hypothetical protein